MMELLIKYRDGKNESKCVDDFSIKNGCLMYYIRFGTDNGMHYIPMDTIANFNVRK